jgi:hypothetical protein
MLLLAFLLGISLICDLIVYLGFLPFRLFADSKVWWFCVSFLEVSDSIQLLPKGGFGYCLKSLL